MQNIIHLQCHFVFATSSLFTNLWFENFSSFAVFYTEMNFYYFSCLVVQLGKTKKSASNSEVAVRLMSILAQLLVQLSNIEVWYDQMAVQDLFVLPKYYCSKYGFMCKGIDDLKLAREIHNVCKNPPQFACCIIQMSR